MRRNAKITMHITCSTCGSEYKVQEIALKEQDVFEYRCDVCDTTVFEWDGPETFNFELLRPGNKSTQP